MEQALAFGASRREAGGEIVKAGVRAALERLVALIGGPGLLLLPPLAAGLVLSGVPLMQVLPPPDCYRVLLQCALSLAAGNGVGAGSGIPGELRSCW